MSTVLILLAISGVVGFLATFAFILYIFTSLGKNVHTLSIDGKVPSLRSPAFLETLSSITDATQHTIDPEAVEIITDNEVYAKRLLTEIEAATDSIAITTYVWEDDDLSDQVLNAFMEAASRGVKVYLLIDGFGGSLSQSRLDQLRESGVQLQIFRAFKPGKISSYVARSHRRVFVFDGTVALMGGMAISRHWLRNHKEESFRYDDIMYTVRGPLVAAIAGSFGELWSAEARVIPQLFAGVSEAPVAERPNALYLSHAPQVDVHPLTYLFWYSIMAAKEEIVISTPYFVPGKIITDILKKKAASGVKITIVTQGTSELWFVQATARSHYAEFLRAGVRIFEHQIPHLHTKASVYDNCFSIVGSANLDIRSQRINHENVLAVQSETFAAKNRAIIESYLKDAKEMHLEDWQQRPFWRGLFERFVRQFSEQF